jgi:uncharacterized delta-60 repeat protein
MPRQLPRLLSGRATATQRHASHRLCRLRVEPLEERALLSAGDLDLTFGTGGLVRTDFSSGNDSGTALAVQVDGKIVVAGATPGAGGSDFAVTRYAAGGSLDPTFGGVGRVATDFGPNARDEAAAVVVQGDGNILVAGTTTDSGGGTRFALAKYTPAGALDTSFGVGGQVITDLPGTTNDNAYDLAVQPDGKIVVVGYSGSGFPTSDFGVVRFKPDGSLDPTFGTGGVVRTDFGGSHDVPFAVALQGDGKVVVGGLTSHGSPSFGLVRYASDGSLDTTFGQGGKVSTLFPGSNSQNIRDLAIQSDGKIVAVGYTDISYFGAQDFAVARYSAAGSLDATFDGDGIVTTHFGGTEEQAFGVLVQPDGAIVVSGTTSAGANPTNFALARYTSGGGLDGAFGVGGQVVTDFGAGVDQANGVSRQADGKLVVVGTAANGTNTDFALARYEGDEGNGGGGGDLYEVDDTANQAKPILIDGTTQPHSLHIPTDMDWVTFTLSRASNVTLETDGVAGGDTRMGLYKENGKLVQANDNAGNGNYSKIVRSGGRRFLPAGTYQVKVDEKGHNNTIADYTIRVTATPALTQLVGVATRGSDTIPVSIRPFDAGRNLVIDPNKTTWIVIHGRASAPDAEPISRLASVIDGRPSCDQVLVLDWQAGAYVHPIGYLTNFTGEDWIQPVAVWAAEELRRVGFSSLGRNLRLNLIGHSWGSYVADETAERILSGSALAL